MEENAEITNKETWKQPKITISTTVDHDLWKAGKENNIAWNEALELGLKILMADQLICDYPNCVLLRKMDFFKKEFENLQSQKEAEGFLNNLQGEVKKDGE